jgi:hypothetical protein
MKVRRDFGARRAPTFFTHGGKPAAADFGVDWANAVDPEIMTTATKEKTRKLRGM